MAQSKQTICAIRFGYGLNPAGRGARSGQDLLGSLKNIDIDRSVSTFARRRKMANFNKIRADATSAAGRKKFERARKKIRGITEGDFRRMLVRAITQDIGFDLRLTQFWADHFTVIGRNLRYAGLAGAHIETAIRPNISGKFGDLLVAAILHPAMLIYLDQVSSVGANSVAGKKRKRGLNENLAREVLELHTMGVGSSYSQKDVRQLAELLTGLSVDKKGTTFRPAMVEPGAEKVLGKVYSSDGSRANIEHALHDLALHRDTAKYLSYKLVHHFVSDVPNPEQVAFMAERYLKTDGDLFQTYAAMLEHPASWQPLGNKVKQPFDFIASALRALDLDEVDLFGKRQRLMGRRIPKVLATMGQPYLKPSGPDGWPERAEYWITPAGMAARIGWASKVASTFAQDTDPRRFLKDTLADAASPKLRALAAGAEVKWEGVALVLASPDFNRR